MINNRIDIMKWLNSCKVTDYSVHEDSLIVDVDNNVDLFELKLTEIPVQFGVVNGYFDCSKNNLTSLKGVPHTLHGNFNCARNDLTSLDYLPHTVKGYLYCASNPLVDIDNIASCNFELDFYHNSADYIESLKEFYVPDPNESGTDKLKLSYKEVQSIFLHKKFNENMIQNTNSINNNKKLKI